VKNLYRKPGGPGPAGRPADGGGVMITGYRGQGGEVIIPAAINGKPVTAIGAAAFEDCHSMVSVTIPSGVTVIGRRAFTGCDSLKKISVSAANRRYKDIDGVLFTRDGKMLLVYPAANTRSAYTIPSGVAVIGERAFAGCSGLLSVTIPSGVTVIGREAFFGCDNLASVTIPESVTIIGAWAFSCCIRLTAVTIWPRAVGVGAGAFADCCSLNAQAKAGIQDRFGDGICGLLQPERANQSGYSGYKSAWRLSAKRRGYGGEEGTPNAAGLSRRGGSSLIC
jgi:hypothetical protein